MLTIETVLDFARWAPSGDNTQPWEFEIFDDRRARVQVCDTRAHCVYDLDGWPTRLAAGALIETAAIAASTLGLSVEVTHRPGISDDRFEVELAVFDAPLQPVDVLAQEISRRSVQRRPYARRAIDRAAKAAVADAVGPGYELRWIEGPARLDMAALMFRSARLRLTTPEAYAVHRDVIEWGARQSVDRVPDQALGVGPPMLAMMRFAMHSWARVQFFNRYLGGTWMPRIQMDWLPAWRCGAHVLLLDRDPRPGVAADLAAGRAMQRLWLTASRLGLSLQPEMTPLIFARYARARRPFSRIDGSLDEAGAVRDRLESVVGEDAVTHGVFLARLGHGPAVTARSVRKELPALRVAGPEVGR